MSRGLDPGSLTLGLQFQNQTMFSAFVAPGVMGAEHLGRCSRPCTGRQEKTLELMFLFVIHCFSLSLFYVYFIF